MTRSQNKKKARKRTRKQFKLGPLRRGMPAKDNIVKVEDFVSPQGDRYQILKTTETDVYDPTPKPGKKRNPKK